MMPLIWVLTVTVASGVTVPSAGIFTWMSPDSGGCHRHGDRTVLPEAPAGGRRNGLLVAQVHREPDHQQHYDENDQQPFPMSDDEILESTSRRGGLQIFRLIYH